MDIVGVHPGARLGIGGGVADGEAVFDDVLAVLDGFHGHLMALRDILQRGDGKAVHLHQSALGDGMQRDNDVVDGADVNCLRHSFSPMYSHKHKRAAAQSSSPLMCGENILSNYRQLL